MKLCQVIAVESKIKSKAHDDLTSVYQKLQKGDLLTGLSRSYTPINDEGEKFPPESKKVQLTVEDALKTAQEALTDLFDNTATKDFANCTAKADVVVGGTVLMKDVPVSYLLFLEKKLTDLHTLVSKLPILDPAENWKRDANQSAWVAEPKQTHKTKKISKAFELSPATEKHPAQVKEVVEDVLVGYWKTLNYSGAMPGDRVKELTKRVESLQKACKFAREEANSAVIPEVKVAGKIFNYIFGE